MVRRVDSVHIRSTDACEPKENHHDRQHDGGSDSFVHISAVQAAGMQTLNKDQRLSYEVERGRNGKESAINLQPA